MSRTRWYAALAGTIALLVAAAIALAWQLVGDASAPPHPRKPTAGGCRGNLPPQWQQALRAAVVALPQPVEPLAVDGSGVLYARTADAAIIAIDKQRNVRTVYHLPPGTAGFQPVQVHPAAGKLVVVTIAGAGDRVSRIDVVDPATGRAQRVPLKGTVDGAAVQDAMLYWDERPDPADPGGMVRRYDLADGATTTVDFGQVTAPVTSATGVSWGSGSVPARLPAKVTSALPADAPVTTDGAGYAWTQGGAVYWASGDGAVRGPLPQHVAATPRLQVVAGPLVLFSPHNASDELYVLDARNGRMADIGLQATGIAVSGGGVVALGGALNGPTGTPPLLQLDTTGLPALGC